MNANIDLIASARDRWSEHGWPEAAAGMAAVTSVMRAHQIFLARVDTVLRPFGLTFARYEMLMLLQFSRRGSMPVTKASARLQVHPTSITNAVGRLEAAGLVSRRRHPTDGRTVLVEITADGRAQALAATTAINASVFCRPGLTAAETETLIRVLGALRAQAGDFQPT